MNSLFILTIHENPFLSQEENPIEKLAEFCPTLEIINDVTTHENEYFHVEYLHIRFSL